MTNYDLPTDVEALETAIQNLVGEAFITRNRKRVDWLLDSYYLRGVRNFASTNAMNGTILLNPQDSNGKIHFQLDILVRKFQSELGRRLRLDINPIVERASTLTLDSLRKASTAQGALLEILKDTDLEDYKKQLLVMQMTYGLAGLGCWSCSHQEYADESLPFEIIPPWELLPVPAIPTNPDQYYGLIRTRYVPLEWARNIEGLKIPPMEALETFEVPIGVNPELYIMEVNATGGYAGAVNSALGFRRGNKPLNVNQKDNALAASNTYVEMDEVFMRASQSRLKRYIVKVGGKLALDTDYEKVDSKGKKRAKKPKLVELPYFPISLARDFEDGSFYGKSFVSLLRPMCLEYEQLVKNQMENAAASDELGILCLPTTMGINKQQLKQAGKPRILDYEPDLTNPQHKPFAIQPVTSNDMPARISQYAKGVIDELAGQVEVSTGQTPGRVESGRGISMLYEANSIALSSALGSLASAFIHSYRAMLFYAKDTWKNTKLASISLDDDHVLGLQVDSTTGKASLDTSLIPDPSEVNVRIESELPQSKAEKKQELITMLQLQIITPTAFKRLNFEKNLGLPVGSRQEFESYRKAKYHNVRLFNDGDTPGEITVNPEADIPEIHIEVLKEFMARPEFMLASAEVRKAFMDAKEAYSEMLGTYPNQLGYPEEEAMNQQQMQQMMMQQMMGAQEGPQGGMVPPGVPGMM